MSWIGDILDTIIYSTIMGLLQILPFPHAGAILISVLMRVEDDDAFNTIVDTARAQRAFMIQKEADAPRNSD